ncbi:citrate synthase/methylcitrate synthase [Metabacillus iocasae]|uniref:Citrate synthase n=1 Tax=Priestia iocasae TaxID=2291674 RepID=A0ABS2QWQ2_9BACI|nr:citrate synthase/methylcitrate synthase [Metabacillus iocasae]MBM7703903.1 citrate synthase [Metabacillus iocasae]
MIYPGLKGIACTETRISDIDGEKGTLIYRGYDIEYLTENYTFEEVAYLLWFGDFPNEAELTWLKEELKTKRVLPDHIKQLIKLLPADMEMMSVMRTAVSALGTPEFGWKPTVDQAILLTAIVPSIIGYRLQQTKGILFNEEIAQSMDYMNYYLYALSGNVPSATHVKALETYMILTLEHGLNASTFSGRVTLSTESDMVSAITSAIGTMKGPLHGGAPSGVIDLLEEVVASGHAEEVIRAKVENGEKIMGFGHRVYKTMDPRAVALKKKLMHMAGKDEWLDLAMDVEKAGIKVLQELKPGRSLYTNVEFYAAAIMKAVNMDPSLFTPTFTASRVVGWTAHLLEQCENNVIYRPSAVYIK